ncbi:MAG: TerB family tellurite resistance protein [Calothrix sp. C42_A2020_038]|nr:TerB family tellurite resistance protein [Calothrix sp. C42_A2020_038]
MIADSSVKKKVKILVGAAWIDGIIQPEERQYLHKIAQDNDLADDPDIKPYLYELLSVKPTEFYNWVHEYLGENPSHEDCQNLIQDISGLIYSDGEVATEEAKLLNKLLKLSDESDSGQPLADTILKQIQKLYRRWVEVQN